MKYRKAVAPSMGSMPTMSTGGIAIPRRKMKSFKIDEISLVDKPAQEGALATISKRALEKKWPSGGSKSGGGKPKSSGAGSGLARSIRGLTSRHRLASPVARYLRVQQQSEGKRLLNHIRDFQRQRNVNFNSPRHQIAEALVNHVNAGGTPSKWKDLTAQYYGFQNHAAAQSAVPKPSEPYVSSPDDLTIKRRTMEGRVRKFNSGASAEDIARYNEDAQRGDRFHDHIRNFEQQQGITAASPPEKISEAIARSTANTGEDPRNWRDMISRHYGFRDFNHAQEHNQTNQNEALINRLQASVGGGMGKRELDRIIKMVLLDGVEDFTHGIAKGAGQIEKAAPFVSALDLSLRSILADNSLGNNDRLLMLRKSVVDFLGAAQAELPGMTTYVRKSADPDLERSSDQMNLRQLQKKMSVLNNKLDATMAKLSSRGGGPEEDSDEFGKGFDDAYDDEELFKAYKAKKKPPMDDTGDGMGEGDIAGKLHALFGGGPASKARRHQNPNADMSMDGGNDIRAEVNPDNADQLDPSQQDDMGVDDPDPDDYGMGKKMKTGPREGLITTEGEEEDTIAAGSKNPIGGVGKRTRLNETLQVGARLVTKADVGVDMFDILKAQQEEMATISKALDDERNTRELLEFSKVADSELSHLPGRTEEKARLLKSLADYLEPDERRLLSSMLKSGDRSAGTAFKTFGHSVAKARTAASFQKRVSDIRARDNCSNVEAMQKARQEHPDDFEAYQAGQ